MHLDVISLNINKKTGKARVGLAHRKFPTKVEVSNFSLKLNTLPELEALITNFIPLRFSVRLILFRFQTQYI